VNDYSEENVQFLFHLISPALYETHDFDSNKEYFASIAGKEYILPNGSKRSFSISTLTRYLRKFKDTGTDGLRRKGRCDNGISRKLTTATEARISEIIADVPKATATSVFQRLKDENYIMEGECSIDTVRRYIDLHEIRNVPVEDAQKLRNSFLVPHAGDLFVADTVYYEKLGNPVKGKKVPWLYVQGIIDDHSRVLMVSETYTEDTAFTFQCSLRKAISLYGIPDRLYVDLGRPYNNHDLTVICNRLGIELIHAHPRDGAAKGVIENKWKLLLSETRVDIVLDNLTTKEELDKRVQEWRETYNSRTNTGVGGIPYERYNASIKEKPIRRVASKEELSEAFSYERIRVIDNLGIIRINAVKYKAPDELRYLVEARSKVVVRYDPLDIENTIHVFFNDKRYPLTIDDPIKNAADNARKALEHAREAKSCVGMTAAEIRAENRYQARMAGTNRVQNNGTNDADGNAENDISMSVEVPEEAASTDGCVAIETNIADLFEEEESAVIQMTY